MSTAAVAAPRKETTMTEETLRPDLQKIAGQVIALREMTRTTGFKTSRSIGDLLNRLNPDDLAAVSLAIQER